MVIQEDIWDEGGIGQQTRYHRMENGMFNHHSMTGFSTYKRIRSVVMTVEFVFDKRSLVWYFPECACPN